MGSITLRTKRVAAGGMSLAMVTTLALAATATPAQADENVFEGPRGDLRTDDPVPATPVAATPKMRDTPHEQVWASGAAAAKIGRAHV